MALSGIITALATPFRADGTLDLDGWERLLRRQLDAGVQGVVVAGSTGEAAALADEEFDLLLRTAAAVVGDRIALIAGTGMSSTARTVAQTRRAAAAGARHALVVTPPYVRPTQQGLHAHFVEVAEHGGLPVILYNVPARTGCDMRPETVAGLCRHASIVGIKEASNDPARMPALLALRGKDFAVFSGDDGNAVPALLAGADGLISVGSNALPATFLRLCDLARQGSDAAARALDGRLRPFYDFCGIEPNPIPIKALLQRAGIGQGLRLPLLPLSAAHHAIADRLAASATALEEQSSREMLAA